MRKCIWGGDSDLIVHMYSEDGIIRFFGDECACEAEFSPIGPSISEWLEEVKEKGR